jgi:hypothetical protein
MSDDRTPTEGEIEQASVRAATGVAHGAILAAFLLGTVWLGGDPLVSASILAGGWIADGVATYVGMRHRIRRARERRRYGGRP